MCKGLTVLVFTLEIKKWKPLKAMRFLAEEEVAILARNGKGHPWDSYIPANQRFPAEGVCDKRMHKMHKEIHCTYWSKSRGSKWKLPKFKRPLAPFPLIEGCTVAPSANGTIRLTEGVVISHKDQFSVNKFNCKLPLIIINNNNFGEEGYWQSI